MDELKICLWCAMFCLAARSLLVFCLINSMYPRCGNLGAARTGTQVLNTKNSLYSHSPYSSIDHSIALTPLSLQRGGQGRWTSTSSYPYTLLLPTPTHFSSLPSHSHTPSPYLSIFQVALPSY